MRCQAYASGPMSVPKASHDKFSYLFIIYFFIIKLSNKKSFIIFILIILNNS